MRYLTNTFSPAMLGSWRIAEIVEVELADIPSVAELTSAISHDVTAGILSALLREQVEFKRINLTLEAGDYVYCIVPNFRASEAREFTAVEVEAAGYRCFLATIT